MLGDDTLSRRHTGEVPGMAALDLGGGYSIDLADADKFIKALQNALERLRSTLDTSANELRVRPPGHDDYSGLIANADNEVADQHRDWNLRKQEELQVLI